MSDFLSLDPFLLRAFAAGIGIVITAGVMGCFVVWRRMAYFGDSLAHSSLLGIALGLVTGINLNLSVIIICTIFAAILVWLQQKKILATDTLLGILAHGALSIGIVVISLLDRQRIDIYSYLFGDILTVTPTDLAWIYGGGAFVLFMLIVNWSSLVIMTINEDLAKAEGVKTFFSHLLFMLMMTIFVALSIRIVGILLITSMLIIPAATARQLATSPKSMAIISSILGIFAVIIGLSMSIYYDLPSGPAIVASSTTLFALLFALSKHKP